MLSAKGIIPPLRVLLVLAFAFLLVMQFLSVPGDIMHDLDRAPEAGRVLWPMLVVLELGIVCVQVVIVCTWRLLTLVKRDRIFSADSLKWVDGISWAFVVGWVLLAGFAAYVTAIIYFTPEIRDPGIPIMLFGAVLVGAVFVLLMLVLRALLRQATALRSDLEEVI